MDIGAVRQALRRFKQWRRLEDDVKMLTEAGGAPVVRALTPEEQKRLFEAEARVRSSSANGNTTDPHDLAVYRLAEDAVRKLSHARFLRLSDGAFGEPDPRAIYTLFGFPGVWTEPITSEAERLSVNPLEFTTYAYDGSVGDIRHYGPRLHILLSAGAEDLTDPHGAPLEFRDGFGQLVRLPVGLKGISGCGVWHIGGS